MKLDKEKEEILRDSIEGALLGLIVGDAVGVPVEFKYREDLDADPVTDMREYGTYDQPAGTWSDDSSMMLASLDSILRCGDYDPEDTMKSFCAWYYDREYTPHGEIFDIGNTCREALRNYHSYGLPVNECGATDERSNGNGSLMRILPVSLLQIAKFKIEAPYNSDELEDFVRILYDASALTHAHPISKICCSIYTWLLFALLDFKLEEKVTFHSALSFAETYYRRSFLGYANAYNPSSEDEYILNTAGKLFHLIALENMKGKDRDAISSKGYVVTTLEAAEWSYMNSDNFRDCILNAVNLGRDTDTVAAVAGGLAGLYYGRSGIPEEWISKLARLDYIEELIKKYADFLISII